ncbi:2597_t:CDS:1, partial [Funneliformis mosseae]
LCYQRIKPQEENIWVLTKWSRNDYEKYPRIPFILWEEDH